MAQDELATDVIFRRFKEGDLIALFPGLAGTTSLDTCRSYQRVGQHGSATVYLANYTKLADYKDQDVLALIKELENHEYRLNPIKKFTPKHKQQRREDIADMRS